MHPPEHLAELAAARGAPVSPAPDTTKHPAEGCRGSGSEKSGGYHASGMLQRKTGRRRMLCVDCRNLGLSWRNGVGGAKGHCQFPLLRAEWPLRSAAPAPLERSPPGSVALAGGGCSA